METEALLHSITPSSQIYRNKDSFDQKKYCFDPKCNSVYKEGLSYYNETHKFQLLDDWQTCFLLDVSFKRVTIFQKEKPRRKLTS